MATKRLITKEKVQPKDLPAGEAASASGEAVQAPAKPKKRCLFCEKKTEPTYTDVATLKRFISDRARIVAKQRSGVCSKHQRRVTKEIKYARHLSLLPFINQL